MPQHILSPEVRLTPVLPGGRLQILDDCRRHSVVFIIVLGQGYLIDLIAKLLNRHILQFFLLSSIGDFLLLFAATLVSCREFQVDHGRFRGVDASDPLLLAGYVPTMLILRRVLLDHREHTHPIMQTTLLLRCQHLLRRFLLLFRRLPYQHLSGLLLHFQVLL